MRVDSCVRFPLAALSIAAFLASPGALHAQVAISEVLASNRAINFDEDGDSSDWVELENLGAEAVNLEGYAISDDSSDPRRWVFPAVTIDPGERILVWCSGKDSFVPSVESITADDSPVQLEPTILTEEADYHYIYGDVEAADLAFPAGWTELDFDDAAWDVGKPGFGFGDDDDRTVLPEDIGAVLLRTRVEIEDPAALPPLFLETFVDDGFLCYVNGQLVVVANVEIDEEEPHFGTLARRSREARDPWRFDFAPAREHFRPGTNLIAFALFNARTSSGDLSLRPTIGTAPPSLHTNFEIARAGETVILTNPNEETVDVVAMDEQVQDRSYGRPVGGDGQFYYLLEPTPLAPNETVWSDTPIPQEPQFSPPGGKFDEREVIIEIDAGFPFAAEIRFTTDGSRPRATSQRYEEPVRLTSSRVIRAQAFHEGAAVSRVATHSYFLRATRFDHPIMSIAMQPGDFSNVHNNSGGRGRPSERPGHVEIFDRAGRRQIGTGMGLRLHGGAGRGGDINIKKAYKMYFRRIYGVGKLNYPLIPDSGLEEFDKLVLRSNFNDGFRTGQQASLIRDELIRDVHGDMGHPNSQGAWYNLFVNGQYRGLYNVVERMDHVFFEDHFPELDNEWEVIKTGEDILDGPRPNRSWSEMKAFFNTADMRDPDVFARAGEIVDIANYTDYMLLNIWAQNHDWPHNNWYAGRASTPDGKWIFMSWDAEFGVGRIPGGYTSNTFTHALGRSDVPLGLILSRLVRNESYQRYLLARLDELLDTALSPENVLDRLHKLTTDVRLDIAEEALLPAPSGRFPLTTWENNIRQMESFARNRPTAVRQHVFAYSGIKIPRATRVVPRRGTHRGDLTVEITSPSLDDTTEVFFNGLPSPEIISVARGKAVVAVPYDLRIEGQPTILVLTAEEREGIPARRLLTVIFPRPELDTLSVIEGAAKGGDTVFIVGEDFAERVRVEFDGVPAPSAEVVDEERTTVRAITPPGRGVVGVRVINLGPPGELESENELEFTYLPPEGAVFTRGDADGNGRLNVSDGVRILRFLFAGAGDVDCAAALDTDASGEIGLDDAVSFLNYLFRDGAPPADPFPECGEDPSVNGLPCEDGGAC